MENRKDTPGKVSAVAKAFRILDCFTPIQTELSLAQLSKMLGIPKSTLLNQIRTLEEAGFLIRLRDGQAYSLGYKIMELSYCAYSAIPVIQGAIPIMENLMHATSETVYLTSHLGGRVFYMECVYPTRQAISYSVTGKTVPMHCTASGKAMLSYMSRDEVDTIIKEHGLPQITKNTITNYNQLLSELELSKERGYAIDLEEESLGVKCLAMAIRNNNGAVAGAISISGSIISMRDEQIPCYADQLARACNLLSQYAPLFPALRSEG
ncbi:IclR family transcriptional regulator [Roseburia hominis]